MKRKTKFVLVNLCFLCCFYLVKLKNNAGLFIFMRENNSDCKGC